MQNKNKIPFYLSWLVIVIATITIWPLALFLLYQRGNEDRNTALLMGVILMVIGSLFGACGLFVIIKFGDIAAGWMAAFLILGIVLIRVGFGLEKEASRFRVYLPLIEKDKVKRLDDLSAKTSLNINLVTKDVKKMFEKNLLPGVSLAPNGKVLMYK